MPKDRIFVDNIPPKSWVHRFVTRHSELSLRAPEHLGHVRKRVTEETIRKWFDSMENFLLTEHGIEAKEFFVAENSNRVFNLDETGFPLAEANKLKIVSERGV